MTDGEAFIKPGRQLAYVRLALFALLALLLFILNRRFGWSAWFSDPERLLAIRDGARANLPLAVLLYMFATVLGSLVLAMPGLLFAVAAGLLFGPVWGTLACALAATLGASLAFAAGRFFLRDALKPWIEKSPRLNRLLFEEAGRRDVYILMITRLLPVFPYNLQNFAYGVTNIRFWPYTLYSFLFMLPGSAVYTAAASGVAEPERRTLYWTVSAILIIAVGALSLWLRRNLDTKRASA